MLESSTVSSDLSIIFILIVFRAEIVLGKILKKKNWRYVVVPHEFSVSVCPRLSGRLCV